MYLITITALVAVCGAAKLDRSYLPPPPSANLAGGSPGSLQAPFVGKTNEALSGLPKGGYTNEFEGVVVDAVAQGTRASSPDDTNLGLSRVSYGSTLSKVGDEAFKPDPVGFRQIPSVSKKELENSYELNNDFVKFSVPSNIQPSSERPQAAQDRVANIIVSDSKIGPTGYAYSFETDNGIAAEENAIESDGVQAQGGFRYKSDDGQVYTVTYTAGAEGFQPKGDHLPTPPPIPEEILRSLEQNAKEEAAGMTNDGSYDAQKYNTEGDYNERYIAYGQNKDKEIVTPVNRPAIVSSGKFNNQNNRFIGSQKLITEQYKQGSYDAQKYNTEGDYNERYIAYGQNKDKEIVTPVNRPAIVSSGKFNNQNNRFIGSQKLITEQYKQGLFNIKSSSDAHNNNMYSTDSRNQNKDGFQNRNQFVPTENSKEEGPIHYTKQQFESGLKEVPGSSNPISEHKTVTNAGNFQTSYKPVEQAHERPQVFNKPSQLSNTVHSSGVLDQSSGLAYRPSNIPSNYLTPTFSPEVIHLQEKLTKQSQFDNRKTQFPTQTLSDSQTTKFGYKADDNSQNIPYKEFNIGIQSIHRQENNKFFQDYPSKPTQSVLLTQSYQTQNHDNEKSQPNKISGANFQNNPNFHHLPGTQQQIYNQNIQPSKPFNTPISSHDITSFLRAQSSQFGENTQQFPPSTQKDMNSANLNQQHYFQTPIPHKIGSQHVSINYPNLSTKYQGNIYKSENTGITEAHVPSLISNSPNLATPFSQQFQSQSTQQSSINVLSASNQQSSNTIASQYPYTQFQPAVALNSNDQKPNAYDKTTQAVEQSMRYQPKSPQDLAPSIPTQQYAGELYQYTKPPESLPSQTNSGINLKYSGKVYEYKKPEDASATTSSLMKQDNLQFTQQNTHSLPKSDSQAQNGKDVNGASNFQTNAQPKLGQITNSVFEKNQPQFGHTFQTTHENTFNQHITLEKLPLENANQQFVKPESSNNKNINKFSQFNTQPNIKGPFSSEQRLQQTHLSTKSLEDSNHSQTSQHQAQFNQRLEYSSQPHFKDVSQSIIGPKEVFSGPRKPPSFDATGYHY